MEKIIIKNKDNTEEDNQNPNEKVLKLFLPEEEILEPQNPTIPIK